MCEGRALRRLLVSRIAPSDRWLALAGLRFVIPVRPWAKVLREELNGALPALASAAVACR